MSGNLIKLLEERVNLRTLIIAIIFIFTGVSLVYAEPSNQEIDSLLDSLGGTIFTAGLFVIFWDFFGRRALLDEVLEKTRITREIDESGLIHIGDAFNMFDDQFKSYLRSTNSLDIFFRYGQTWRNYYRSELEYLSKKQDAKIRVILPNPENDALLKEIASRMNNKEAENVREKILATTNFFRGLVSNKMDQESVLIYYCNQSPLFSYYVFDNKTVYSLYSHAKEKKRVPTFVCDANGFLYSFIKDDFKTILKDDTTIKVE